MTAQLFSPITIGGLEFPNRIAVAPMCQYSADDGSASDWHLQQWMMYALTGAGMVTMEMTDVERRGRISHGCLGLYSDHNEAAAKRTLDAARRVAQPGTKFGVQLAHAGRKASCQRPWEGGGPLRTGQDPWQTVSASALPFDEGWHTPHPMTEEEIHALIGHFVKSAHRAPTRRFRLHRDPRRAWLSAAPVHLAALQPPQGRMGRLAEESRAARLRDRQGGEERRAEHDGRRAHLGHRLGRRRPDRRGRRRGGAGTRGRRALRISAAPAAATRRCSRFRPDRATRCISPRR